MNNTSFVSRLVSSPAKSPGLSNTGPEVVLIDYAQFIGHNVRQGGLAQVPVDREAMCDPWPHRALVAANTKISKFSIAAR
jgi:hypothetical protein